jgi:hypothetical protein
LEKFMRYGLAAAAVLIAVQLAGAQGPKVQPAARFGWHTSWQTARDEARRQGKPLFVVFRCEP